NRVYCSSGRSRTFDRPCVFCVDARTGQKIWQEVTDLPAWGSPTVAEGRVFVGLGNSRINEKVDNPRGAVLCLDAFTGREVWRFNTRGAVHTRPVSDGRRVFAGSQDGLCFALDCRDGRRALWKKDLGSPVESSPALARGAWSDEAEGLYVASHDGDVYCLDPATGKVHWHPDELTNDGPTKKGFTATLLPGLTAQVRRTKQGDERRLYFAAGVNGNTAGVVFCLEEEWTDEEK